MYAANMQSKSTSAWLALMACLCGEVDGPCNTFTACNVLQVKRLRRARKYLLDQLGQVRNTAAMMGR